MAHVEDTRRPEVLNDTIQYTYELSVSLNASKNLLDFVHLKHGTSIFLPWPKNWVFTYWNFRKDQIEDMSLTLIKENYLCCDKFVVPVGVVHERAIEPGRQHPVVFIGEGGRVYLHDVVEDAIYLLSFKGFVDFCDIGLEAFHTLKEHMSIMDGTCKDRYLQKFISVLTLTELINVRDQLIGKEVTVNIGNDTQVTLIISNVQSTGYTTEKIEQWAKQAESYRIDVFICLRKWFMQRWINIPILVDDTMKVFAVDPENGNAYFMAKDVLTFLKIGLLRFQNNYRYYRNCYSNSTIQRVSSTGVGTAFRPTDCSRTIYCRRKKVSSENIVNKCYRSLKRVCAIKSKQE